MTSARYTYPTTDITRSIFGNNITPQEARKIWETSSTETQCTHSTGAGAFKNGKTTCYICGMIITKSDTDKDGRNPECEHILPILQAVIYLGLYSHKEATRIPGSTFEEYKINPTTIQNPFYNQELVNLEYAWSHRACNQIKSDNIYMDIYDGQFKVDENGLKGLLGEIWDTEINGYKAFRNVLRSKYNNNKKYFINQRTNNTSDLIIRFNAIVNKLNSRKAPYVTLLAGVASMLEGSMQNTARTQIMTPKDRYNVAKKKYDDTIEHIIGEYIHITKKELEDIRSSNKFKEIENAIIGKMDECIKLKLIMDFNNMNPKSWKEGVKYMCKELIRKREKEKRPTKRKWNNTNIEAVYHKEFDIAKKILENPNKSTINIISSPRLITSNNNNNNRAKTGVHMLVDMYSKKPRRSGGTHKRTRKRKF